ncbi:MAG: O-methyltransferase [Rhizobiales bacterium]|nr:O-methyltransferase [Hyphomicrobiales bacterium]
MSLSQWTAVDNYYNNLLLPEDEILEHVRQSAIDAELPPIAVSDAFGKYLEMMVKISGAKRILEIGTLAGFSTICMARALPEDGKLITMEYEQKNAGVSRANFKQAGLEDKIELRQGAALESLKDLIAENPEPFDFVFIDADKENIANYLELSLKLSRKGTIIITDNVVRDGEVIDMNSEDEMVKGVQKGNEFISKQSGVSSTTIQTVGEKGYDGFLLTVVE